MLTHDSGAAIQHTARAEGLADTPEFAEVWP